MATVRGLQLAPLPGSGALSSWLVPAMAIVPLGGRELRVVLPAAVGVALGGWLAYWLIHGTLARNAATPRLTPLLALSASLLATLGPSWQAHGTVAGGATLAATIVLAALLVRSRLVGGGLRTYALLGILAGLAGYESLWAGFGAALVLVFDALRDSQAGFSRTLRVGLVASCVTFAMLALPVLAQPVTARAWLDAPGVAGAEMVATTIGAARWLEDPGLLCLVLAPIGGLVGLLTPALRREMIPWLPLLAADGLLLGALEVRPDVSTGVLPLLASVGLVSAAALGAQSAGLALVRARIPLAQPASVLLVVVFTTLVFVTVEDGGRRVAQRRAPATQTWTDEALESLPVGAVLLVRSPEVIWRLRAMQVVSDERPDLLVVPLPLLDRGPVAASLLRREPALGHLLRDLAVSGRPGEYALSTLADEHPLYVELDPAWDRRLLDHLIPHPLWLEFAPHALGRSDRRSALQGGREAFGRVLDHATDPLSRDEATLAVLAARAKEHAMVLASLGDRELLEGVLTDLEAMDTDPLLVEELRRRLQRDRHGAIDVLDLFALGSAGSSRTSG